MRRRVRLAWRVIESYVRVRLEARRGTLPEQVAALASVAPVAAAVDERVAPRRLGRAVYRVLNAGPARTRCLWSAMVLFRLLREQGDPAELVIGLPDGASDHTAHAWVEVDGVDVGPPPGRGDRMALARYP